MTGEIFSALISVKLIVYDLILKIKKTTGQGKVLDFFIVSVLSSSARGNVNCMSLVW